MTPQGRTSRVAKVAPAPWIAERFAAHVVAEAATSAASPLTSLAGLRPPRHVLIHASDAGQLARAVLEATATASRRSGAEPLRSLLLLDGNASSACRAAQSLGAPLDPCDSSAAVAVYAARLAGRGDCPHWTRIRPLVERLRTREHDLVLWLAPRDQSPRDAGCETTQLLRATGDEGIWARLAPGLASPNAPSNPCDLAVALAIADQGGRQLTVPLSAPGARLDLVRVATRTPRSHEHTGELRAALEVGEPEIASAMVRRDRGLLCRALRRWLAPRLSWASDDLLLPLSALPPVLPVADVVDGCAVWDGGVQSLGAAVTFAMLLRAFDLPATVYCFGIPGRFVHASTLVGLGDGRIELHDALLDAQPTLENGTALDLADVLERRRSAGASRIRLVGDPARHRLHLYSRGALEPAVARDLLAPQDARNVARLLEGMYSTTTPARWAIAQGWSFDLTCVARWHGLDLPCDGIGWLLGRPVAAVPGTGDPSTDAALVRMLAAGESPRASAPGSTGAPTAPGAPA